MNSRAVIAAVILCSCFSCGCGIQPPPSIRPQEANAVSLNPQDWYIFYSAGMPVHPASDPAGAWSFEFPLANGHVNYVQTPFNATMVLHNVTLTFQVQSDTPQYLVSDASDHLPATFHVFFEQQNDDLSNPNGRWWAQPIKYDFGSQDNTTITYIVPPTSDEWTNVIGESDSLSFDAALANVGWMGITFGGQFFFGHGVALSSGRAKYVLVDFHTD